MKKLLLLLLLSIGLIGISYAVDSQEAIEREIAEFEAELAAELAAQAFIDKQNKIICNLEKAPVQNWIIQEGWTCNEGYIKYEKGCFKEGALPQDVIEREIAEFEAELAAELALEEATIGTIRARLLKQEKTICHPPPGLEQKIAELKAAAKAEAKARLEAELAAQEMMAEIESAKTRALAEKEAVLEAWAQVWVADIATKVKSYWNFPGAEDGWFVEVLVTQNKEGKVLSVTLGDNNVGNSSKANAFLNSVERAVYKSSPLPISPDASVWDSNIRFTFISE